MSWDQAEKEALARANTSSNLFWGVELRHSLFPGPVRMVNHDVDVPLPLEAGAPEDGGTTQNFVATAFQFREPDISPQPDPTVSIQFDGVSGTLQPFVSAAVVSGEPIELTLRGFMYNVKLNSLDQMLQVYHFQARSITGTMESISGVFGYTNAANQPFPRQKYDAISNPGLL